MSDQIKNDTDSSNSQSTDGGFTLDVQLCRNLWNRIYNMYQSNDAAAHVMNELVTQVMIDYITNRVYTDDQYAKVIGLRIQSIMNDLNMDVSKVGL